MTARSGGHRPAGPPAAGPGHWHCQRPGCTEQIRVPRRPVPPLSAASPSPAPPGGVAGAAVTVTGP